MHARPLDAFAATLIFVLCIVWGFNQVVVEGVLANRPVVTSRLCPAIQYVRDDINGKSPTELNAGLLLERKCIADPTTCLESKPVSPK